MEHAAALQIHMLEPERRTVPVLTALLPPLALFFSLAAAFGALFASPLSVFALLTGAAAAAAGTLLPGPAGFAARLLPIPGAGLVFALSAAARNGAALLFNRLFEASEAVNAYRYAHFSVSGADGSPALTMCLCAFALFGGAFCALVCRRRGAAVGLFLLLAFTEAYFGVTPGLWRNLLLFAVLAELTLRKRSGLREHAALLAGFAAVALAVLLLAPRPSAVVEAYSERLRDELGLAALSLTREEVPETEDASARHESRLHEEASDVPEDAARREFEKETENERELSLPRRFDWLRAALLLLAVAALLLVPFLPFALLDRAKRLAAERRGAFDDPDNAAAIRAMFAHTMDWLRANGLQTENRPFARCAEDAGALLHSEEYAARYAESAAIWREAAYSDHAMTDAQRDAVRALLRETETSLYARANRRTRFRLKYVEHLCGS